MCVGGDGVGVLKVDGAALLHIKHATSLVVRGTISWGRFLRCF
jgi:hypothetical protein